jgi:hypothetical protein
VLARETRMREDIRLKTAAGLGGALNGEEKNFLDGEAMRLIDFQNLNEPQQRSALLQFARTNQYVPTPAMAWMSNQIRSNNWQAAFEFYDNVKTTTVGASNARVGDKLLAGLDARSAALFDYAEMLYRNGESVQKIGMALGDAMRGQGRTPEEARNSYNLALAKPDNRSPYDGNRRGAIVQALGLPAASRNSLDEQMLKDVDASFAINLELLRDPEAALTASINQVKKAYRTSNLFVGGVGPASLIDSYERGQIAEFLTKERTETGQPLLPAGITHRLGGNVKLKAIDNHRQAIGEYKVVITDPDNPVVVLDSYTINLGQYLPEYFNAGDADVRVKNREQRLREAAAKRAGQQNTLTNMGQSADRGPKY